MQTVRVTATGTVKPTSGQPGARPKLVILTPAAATATLVLRDGGAAGTVMLELQAALSGNSAVVNIPDGQDYRTDVHATLVGVGAVAYVGF